jgi:hypothetical protein
MTGTISLHLFSALLSFLVTLSLDHPRCFHALLSCSPLILSFHALLACSSFVLLIASLSLCVFVKGGGDDSLAIKSDFSLGAVIPSYNITVRLSTISTNGATALEIGSETVGDFYGIDSIREKDHDDIMCMISYSVFNIFFVQ